MTAIYSLVIEPIGPVPALGRDGFSAVRKTNRTKTLPDGLSLNKRKDKEDMRV